MREGCSAVLPVSAVLLAPRSRAWLATTRRGRILHLFDRVGNLANEKGEVLSLVTPEVGPGPFNLVLSGSRPFTEILSQDDTIDIKENVLCWGNLKIDFSQAAEWLPVPDWARLRQDTAVWSIVVSRLQEILADFYRRQNGALPGHFSEQFGAAVAVFLRGLAAEELAVCRKGIEQLAGLGPGLTPAGDDFLMGAMYGLWASAPDDAARFWGRVIVETAVPLTTTLSAAWLQAAAQGEAVAAWHTLCRQKDFAAEWETAVAQILNTGHSSGADALSGFTAVLSLKTRRYW